VKEIAVAGFIDIHVNGMKDAIESQEAPVKKTRRKKSV
jgi:N-acetylglucosamine-6-phosphate deacetylase